MPLILLDICAAKFLWYFLFVFLTLLYYTFYGTSLSQQASPLPLL